MFQSSGGEEDEMEIEPSKFLEISHEIPTDEEREEQKEDVDCSCGDRLVTFREFREMNRSAFSLIRESDKFSSFKHNVCEDFDEFYNMKAAAEKVSSSQMNNETLERWEKEFEKIQHACPYNSILKTALYNCDLGEHIVEPDPDSLELEPGASGDSTVQPVDMMDVNQVPLDQYDRWIDERISQLNVEEGTTWEDINCWCLEEALTLDFFTGAHAHELKKVARFSPYAKYREPKSTFEHFFNLQSKNIQADN